MLVCYRIRELALEVLSSSSFMAGSSAAISDSSSTESSSSPVTEDLDTQQIPKPNPRKAESQEIAFSAWENKLKQMNTIMLNKRFWLPSLIIKIWQLYEQTLICDGVLGTTFKPPLFLLTYVVSIHGCYVLNSQNITRRLKELKNPHTQKMIWGFIVFLSRIEWYDSVRELLSYTFEHS